VLGFGRARNKSTKRREEARRGRSNKLRSKKKRQQVERETKPEQSSWPAASSEQRDPK